MSENNLQYRIKNMIIETLNIPDVTPEEISDDEMIFESEKLGLDSLDGLELVMGIQREFSVMINDQNHAHNILQTVNTIAEFVESENSATD